MVVVNPHKPHDHHYCIDAFKEPEDPSKWLACPQCGLKPRIWTFDNGRYTACGCWTNKYKHHSAYAESITSVYSRTGRTVEYDSDGLTKAWNHWCETGEHLFEPYSSLEVPKEERRW